MGKVMGKVMGEAYRWKHVEYFEYYGYKIWIGKALSCRNPSSPARYTCSVRCPSYATFISKGENYTCLEDAVLGGLAYIDRRERWFNS